MKGTTDLSCYFGIQYRCARRNQRSCGTTIKNRWSMFQNTADHYSCTMGFIILVMILLTTQVNSSSLERRQTIQRVREYLRQYDIQTKASEKLTLTTPWLENSNKIGFGFNVLTGSPVCYTGLCQMDGFTRSIFKLNYVSPVQGSCTPKLVPDHVELDCLPSTTLSTISETIATVEQLKKSISDKVEISLSAGYMVASFSYSYSKETRKMIDNIVRHDTTSIFTSSQVSYAKLSMFEPQMELSENFRYVIENMPCCELDDVDIEEYINEFIFEYFGFTYITRILLGGIAQQNIIIDRRTHERMVNTGTDTKHQAQISFKLKFSASASTTFATSEEEIAYYSFMRQVQSTDATTLGGDVHLTTLSDWSKTVPSNPVIIKFSVRDIFRLLTKSRFPNDALIANKSALIKLTLNKYLNKTSVYCYGDCGGNNGSQGTCIPSGHFQFGECHCNPGWSGVDCTVPITTTNKILHGTICGFDRSFIKTNCEGLRPFSQGCPSGWIQYIWDADLTVCFKNGTSLAKPVVGTLCGLYVTYSFPLFSSDISCNNISLKNSVNLGLCPPSYQRVTASKGMISYRNSVCASLNAEADLPGTICGMQIDSTINGPTCDGYNPGLRQCPPTHSLLYTMFNTLGFFVCVKN